MRSSPPVLPDLSDSKWLEYIRRSDYLTTLEPPAQSKTAIPIPVNANIIPELSHLTITKPTQRTSMDAPSIDLRRLSRISSLRRHAKTPVFAVGQLEEMELRKSRIAEDLVATDGTNDSADAVLTADQRSELLESPGLAIHDSNSEPARSRPVSHLFRRQHSSDDLHYYHPDTHHLVPPALAIDSPLVSPQPESDDGTLVSFEEETIYFKPLSFSSESSSPKSVHQFHPPPRAPQRAFRSSPSPAPDNLSLQICLDLLARELASGMSASRPPHMQQQSIDTSALQIWVMIEAYEHLRNNLLDMYLTAEQAQPLEMMFDMWLRALYSIHDSMTKTPTSEPESEYEELEEPLD